MKKIFYHGTSSSCKISHKLLPPSMTGTLSEKCRKKNLDKIFLQIPLSTHKYMLEGSVLDLAEFLL